MLGARLAPHHCSHLTLASLPAAVGPRSIITRACQGFLQNVAFPLQFEFLFSFPGEINPEVFDDGMAGDFGTARAKMTRLDPSRNRRHGAEPIVEWRSGAVCGARAAAVRVISPPQSL